jgi:exodeoxyribonuclease V alpha subunit
MNNLSSESLIFSRLDRAFAQFLAKRCLLTGKDKATFKRLVMQCSFEQSKGHTCLPLTSEEEVIVLASGLVLEVTLTNGLDVAAQPLVLQSTCLYTYRYWFYEARLAFQLSQRLHLKYSTKGLEQALTQYFGSPQAEIDWQREAAKKALRQGLTLVIGGPGTGKTTTVIKILALLQQLNDPLLTIALVAPTGKAAMRLQASLGESKQTLNCDEIIKQMIPESVTTIHRLLGAKPPPSPYFKHHSENLLPYDVVVVDETSMVDLALMSKLVDALPQETRLILLGDKDQLASVASGSVLADLTDSLRHYSTELLKSHRFGGEIKALAMAINQQQATAAWQLLEQGQNVCLFEGDLMSYVMEQYTAYHTLVQKQADFKQIYTAFNRFQVLCSNRQGRYGVNEINRLVEKSLKLSGSWYQGRPIMVIENNAATQLYNGDIGICLMDKHPPYQLRVHFLTSDGGIKKILPSRMPQCETVFAMTIHKSQGSEFEKILIALPEVLNLLLTKELLYTGITRAKKKVKVLANKRIFIAAITQKVIRHGGLKARIEASF